MTLFDILILAILIFSAVISLFRGFLKEVISLITWILAIWLGFALSTVLGPDIVPEIPFLRDWSVAETEIGQAFIGGLFVFFCILILGAWVNYLFSIAVDKSWLTRTDRVLGALFGFLRGVLIVALVVLLLGKIEFVQGKKWWVKSMFRPPAQKVAKLLQKVVPDKYEDYLSD